MPPEPPHPLRRRFIEFQIRARARPGRTAVVQGILSGFLFALFWFAAMWFDLVPSESFDSAVEAGFWALAMGVAFGATMGGWFAWYARRADPEPLVAGTRAEDVLAARRQLEGGHLGGPPEIDRLTVQFARQMLRMPWWPRTSGVFFALMAMLNWTLVALSEGSWIHLAGAVMFTVGVVSLYFCNRWVVRRRAAAEEVLALADTGEAPPAPEQG
ncbi:hypothetical protein IDM40_07145 [Nocardiopsis sp. HNM0947]|uniref:Uncharacterized protein n=1 Tax=Nocardiopsis coralli TaxID=2772213 RepID=A0ABR9P3Q7_9ACTN|nr:hypothetical protein [Nocardiopsis coralli]MBE2998479.1 hypothetical protein [Nocardiopsis coralli]